MPEAEIKVRTTHDGTQAERSISRLQSSIERLGGSLTGKIQGAFLGFFSAEKIIQFGKAIDASLMKTAALVDKIREGKATVDELDRTGVSREQAGFATEFERFKKQISGPMANIMAVLARIGIAGVGLGTGVGRVALGNADVRRLVAASVAPNIRRIDEAAEEGNRERERQSMIDYIQKMESDSPPPTLQPAIEEKTIQRSQLEELRRISRSLNPTAARLLDRKTMFPE